MTITVKINCDNAAFDDGGPEVARMILRYLAEDIESNQFLADYKLGLRDINGNGVGQCAVTGRRSA